ncbi:hypothetical protein ACFL4S_02060, partial [bacterium]
KIKDIKNKVKKWITDRETSRYPRVLRSIAGFVLIAFITTSFHDFVWAREAAGIGDAAFFLPQRLGKITERYDSGTKGKVIYIQDVHCHKETQEKIYKIIKLIKEKYGSKCGIVGVEGAYTNIDTSILGAVPDKEIKEKTAQYFLNKGDITGAELYSIMEPGKVKLKGIENEKEYFENFNKLYNSFSYLSGIEEAILKIGRNFERSKKYLYPESLKEFELKEKSFNSGVINMEEYLRYIKSKAEENKIKFEMEYKELSKAVKLYEMKKEIKEELAEFEARDITEKMSRILTQGEYEELKRINIEQEAETYYLYLNGLIKKRNIDIGSGYKNLSGYLSYLELNAGINDIKLMEELKEAEYRIKEELVKGGTHRKSLLYCERYLELLKGYLTNQAGSKDVELWRRERERFFKEIEIMTEKLAYENYFKQNKELFYESEKNMSGFYSTADKRNHILADNISKGMKGKNEVRIMTAGGYHTDGIKELLKAKGISYEIITPKITSQYGKNIYINRVKEQGLWHAKEKGLAVANKPVHTADNKALMVLTRFAELDLNENTNIQMLNNVLTEILSKFGGSQNIQQAFTNFLVKYTKKLKNIKINNIDFSGDKITYTAVIRNTSYEEIIMQNNEKNVAEKAKKEKQGKTSKPQADKKQARTNQIGQLKDGTEIYLLNLFNNTKNID